MFKRIAYTDSEEYYSQDTSARNKVEECDVYVKTENLSKDQFVVVSQEELASLVLCVMHKWSRSDYIDPNIWVHLSM